MTPAELIQQNRDECSKAWDRMCLTPGSCLMTHTANGAVALYGYHWDIPRDAWNALYLTFGEARALIEIESPARPFAGVAVFDQPRECLDTWERYIASLS